jgi:hypothetical protein
LPHWPDAITSRIQVVWSLVIRQQQPFRPWLDVDGVTVSPDQSAVGISHWHLLDD